jgi:hypothetical protein
MLSLGNMHKLEILMAGLAFADFMEPIGNPLPGQDRFRLCWDRGYVDDDTDDKTMAQYLVRVFSEVINRWLTVHTGLPSLIEKDLETILAWAVDSVPPDLYFRSIRPLSVEELNHESDMASVEDCVSYIAVFVLRVRELLLGSYKDRNASALVDAWTLGLKYRGHKYHEVPVSDIQAHYYDYSDGNNDGGPFGGKENQPLRGQEVHGGNYVIGRLCRYCSRGVPTAMGSRRDRNTGERIISPTPLTRFIQGNYRAKKALGGCMDCSVSFCSKECFRKWHRIAIEKRYTEDTPRETCPLTQHHHVKKDISRSSKSTRRTLRELPDTDGRLRRTSTTPNGAYFEIMDETAPTTEASNRNNLGNLEAGLIHRNPVSSLQSRMAGHSNGTCYRNSVPGPSLASPESISAFRIYNNVC